MNRENEEKMKRVDEYVRSRLHERSTFGIVPKRVWEKLTCRFLSNLIQIKNFVQLTESLREREKKTDNQICSEFCTFVLVPQQQAYLSA